MGYGLRLIDKNGNTCQSKADRYIFGNTICLNGSKDLEFNITYNYSPYYYEVEGFEKDGIRKIYGLTGKQSIPLLQKIISSIHNKYVKNGKWITTKRTKKIPYNSITNEKISDRELVFTVQASVIYWREEEVDRYEGYNDDYWEATAGNALKAVEALLDMAVECPEGIWEGD